MYNLLYNYLYIRLIFYKLNVEYLNTIVIYILLNKYIKCRKCKESNLAIIDILIKSFSAQKLNKNLLCRNE